MQGANFTTFDVKQNKWLTEDDVFVKNGQDSPEFDKSIMKYLKKGESEEETLKAEITTGFTPTGFYILTQGNHGFFINPVWGGEAIFEGGVWDVVTQIITNLFLLERDEEILKKYLAELEILSNLRKLQPIIVK